MNRIAGVIIFSVLLLGALTTVQAISDRNQQLIDAAREGDTTKVKALIAAGAKY